MKKIISIIDNNKLNKSELLELNTFIKTKIEQIDLDVDKEFLIPSIFHSYVTSITFNCNYDKENNIGFDSYKEIYCNGLIILGKNMRIGSSYSICSGNDFNSNEVSIFFEKCFRSKKSNKLFWKKYDINYNCNGHWSNSNNNGKYITQISVNTLTILDILKLEQNVYNRKMLGVLINNIVARTERECDDECCCYQEQEIDCNELSEINNNKSLINDLFLKISDDEQITFQFINKN